jgi:hypothetical protein
MDLIKDTNLAVRFVLELSALIALGAWEYSVGGGWAAKVGLAVGVPVATAVIWGTFVSPGPPCRCRARCRSCCRSLSLGRPPWHLSSWGTGCRPGSSGSSPWATPR